MHPTYFVVLEAGRRLPERSALLKRAWGDLPVSYIQDRAKINSCSYLDVKVNKWEVDKRWSIMSTQEACIRIEFLRRDKLANFINERDLPLAVNTGSDVLVVLQIDGDVPEIEADRKLAEALAVAIADGGRLYVYDEGMLSTESNSQPISALSAPALKDLLLRGPETASDSRG